jgi:hypothetical protein
MYLENDNDDYVRYKRLRAVSKELNSKLTQRLHKKELYRGAKDLGLLRKKTLVFNSVDHASVLMDYCIHNPSGKKSCIDLYIEQSSLEQVSDEMMMLKALRESFFSIIQVHRTEKGYLCYVGDVLRDQDIVLADVGLGSSSAPGTLVVARLMKIPGSNYFMTTGAPMQIQDKWAIDAIDGILSNYIDAMESGNLSVTQANSLGKQVIRALLRQDNGNLTLADPEEHEEALRKAHLSH